MKLLDKLKDLFMDEVIEDEEEEEELEERLPKLQRKEKVKEAEKEKVADEPRKDELPKVMQETIKKEEKVDLRVKPEEFVNKDEKTIPERQPKFNFPLDIDMDFPSRDSRKAIREERQNIVKPVNEKPVNEVKEEEVTKKLAEMYTKKEPVKVKPKFKASPVISPVYGVLDKNYRKDEVKEKNEDMFEMKRPSKKVDFETVRKKAFGNLADEIKDNLLCENCELYKEVKKISSLREDDLLYDMTVDSPKEVTLETAYDNYEEFGVTYEPVSKKNSPIEEESEEKITTKSLLDRINEVNKEDDALEFNDLKENEEVATANDDNVLEDVKKRDEEINSDVVFSREKKKKETKVDDDFFKLIDSMYKERSDD